jgi:L-lactate dehydrogenase complex protein LldG
MTMSAREEIFKQLNQMGPSELKPRPPEIPQIDLPDDIDGRIETFMTELTAKAGVAYRAENEEAARKLLTEIAATEQIKTIMIAGDDTTSALNLKEWGEKEGVSVLEAAGYDDRNDYRRAAFEEADAGITGVDFAFSESGTLAIRHNSENTRMVSLAPPIHIAIFPAARLSRYYEEVVLQAYSERGGLPSQMTFITGPSMTGDIAGTMTIGMHGPKKLFAIIIG